MLQIIEFLSFFKVKLFCCVRTYSVSISARLGNKSSLHRREMPAVSVYLGHASKCQLLRLILTQESPAFIGVLYAF